MKTTRFQNHQKGYVLEWWPHHPYRNKDGFVPQHRIVVERRIGKVINPFLYDVHHKDGDVKNNRSANLQLLTKSEHRRVHASWRKIRGKWWKTCGGCKRFLRLEGNFYRRDSGNQEFMAHCKECNLNYSRKHAHR